MKAQRLRLIALLVVFVASAGTTACTDEPCRLCDAVEARDAAAVRALIDEGEAVTTLVLEVATDPNRLATRLGGGDPEAHDRKIVEMVIERGDPNAQWTVGVSDRWSNRTSRVRHYLAASVMHYYGDAAMVDLLVRRGLDMTSAAAGETVRVAVVQRRHDAVRALIDAGAPLNLEGVNPADRATPLAEAIQTRDAELIAMLEAAGAVEWIE